MSKNNWQNIQTISRMLKSSFLVGIIISSLTAEIENLSEIYLLELYRFRFVSIPISSFSLQSNLSCLSGTQMKAVEEGLENLAEQLGFEIELGVRELGSPTDLEYCLIIRELTDIVIDDGGDGDDKVDPFIPLTEKGEDGSMSLKYMVANA